MLLTDRIISLYDTIQKTITGRYAMWPMDAAAWYYINSISIGDTLEIGSAFGGSAAMAAMAKMDAGIKLNYIIYCVDPLDGYYGNRIDLTCGVALTYDIFTMNLEKLGVLDKIRIFKYKTPPLPPEISKSVFSCILIDGNHNNNGPLYDWECVKDRVSPGGFVMFHDVHKKGVIAAWDKAQKEPEWKIYDYLRNPGPGTLWVKKVEGSEEYGSYGILQRHS